MTTQHEVRFKYKQCDRWDRSKMQIYDKPDLKENDIKEAIQKHMRLKANIYYAVEKVVIETIEKKTSEVIYTGKLKRYKYQWIND